MPERFYQASMFLLFLLFLNAVDCGPRLKNCRGDELGVIETFRSDDLLFRHSRNAGGHPPPLSFPKSFIRNPNAFKCCGLLINILRGDDLPHPSFPKSSIGNPSFCFFFGFKTMDPGLKIAGVTNKGQ